jgi:acyl-CoA thioester hydrolase
MDTTFEHEVDVRYRDIDAFGHVNNVVYGTYCEEARVAYMMEVLELETLDDLSVVVVSLDVDFRSPVSDPSTVDVGLEVVRIGTASFSMAYELRQHGELVAEAETTQVHVDTETGESRLLPEEWRERLAEYEELDA